MAFVPDYAPLVALAFLGTSAVLALLGGIFLVALLLPRNGSKGGR